MTRLRDNRGFVLTEVLIVMVIGLVLLTATLLTFDRMMRNSDTNAKRNDSAQAARNSLEIEARQLRNLAKRVNDAVIKKVTPDDFIFQTSDPSRTWVRYCLDTTAPADRSMVWEQTQAADAPGADTACPATTGWAATRIAAYSVTNRIGGRDKPLFSYRCQAAVPNCTAASSTFDAIIGVDAQLYIDTTPGKAPPELRVASGVYLRNQNQSPTAQFSFSNVTGSTRTIQLNASASSDFEGRTLEFYWFLNQIPARANIDCSKTTEAVAGTTVAMWGGTFVGRGVVLQYTWPGTTPVAGTAQTIGLVACDPGDRFALTTQTITIP